MQLIVWCKKRERHRSARNILLLCLALLGTQLARSQPFHFRFKNAALETVLNEVEKKTGYHFIYTREELESGTPVTLSISAANMETLLRAIFQNQPLSYSQKNQYVTIFRQDKPERTTVKTERLTIRGVVRSENDEPVAGATVHATATNVATSTDPRGAFELSNVVPGDQLVISSVGFVSRRIPVIDEQPVSIRLPYSNQTLEETVIKGYYTTPKRFNTAAVSKVAGEALTKQPVSNPLAGLEGRVPGLFIRQSNGLPGSNFTLLLRGQNSLRSGTAPLFIIDGIPFPVTGVSQRGAGLNSNNPFNTIAPSDIESIEILKDADAIAIYGSRGANGVILITTKKAREGGSSLDVNVYTGWGRITRSMDYLKTADYLAMRREAFRNDGQTPNSANAPDLLVWDTTRYIDWKKLLIGGTAHLTNAQVRYSAGSPSLQFSASSTYYRESTVFPGNLADSRATTDLALNHVAPSGKFRAGFSTSYAYEENKLLNQDLSSFINLPPDAPFPYDSLGRLNWSEHGVSFSNPLASLQKTYLGKSRRLTASCNLQFQLLPAVKLRVNSGYNSFQFDETLLTPIAAQNPAFGPVGYASFGHTNFSGWIVEPQVEYATALGKGGKLESLLGSTLQANSTESTIIDAAGYTNDALLQSIGGANSTTAANTYTKYKYGALYARLNYTLNNRYIVNLTGRRDGSSRFGPGKQFANFGAVGLGWILTQEKAVQAALPFLSFGKLRASYGTSGNDQIGDYQYLDTWTTTQYGYGNNVGLAPTRLFNAGYSWELNTKLDIGLESGFWNNQVAVTVDWYRNRSKNQLIPFAMPSQTGFTSIIKNFPGIIENRGLETTVSSTPVQTSRIRWKVDVNLTVATNKLVSFPGLESSPFVNTYRLGKPVNAHIGYSYTGIDPQKGVYQFDDINKDGRLNTQDYDYNGTTDPAYYGGLQNSLEIKNWTLQWLFQFIRQKGITPVWGGFQQVGNRTNQPVLVLDRWSQPYDAARYQKYTQTFGSPATGAALLMFQSSGALTDASFVRLKTASLSYDLPTPALKKMHLQKLQLYALAQNLLTFTPYQGADPENATGLPPLRVITLGAAIHF